MSQNTDHPPILKLRHVRRCFLLGETTIDALRDVSLDIHAGEFLAVWGPSGSGKTTLMNIIGLIDAPTEGEVSFEEQDTRVLADNALTEFRGEKIGFVFQSFNLVPVLSALENVMLPLQIKGVDDQSARVRATAALVDVGLERFQNSLPDKLSGGQRQRVVGQDAGVLILKMHFALGRRIDQADDVHQRRFAATRRTPYGEELASVDVEREAVQGIDMCFAQAETAAHIAQLEDGRGRGVVHGRPRVDDSLTHRNFCNGSHSRRAGASLESQWDKQHESMRQMPG